MTENMLLSEAHQRCNSTLVGVDTRDSLHKKSSPILIRRFIRLRFDTTGAPQQIAKVDARMLAQLSSNRYA
jgi:hypothetical protein